MNLLINGLITGAVFAIAASGLVVTYSTSGVFNFAHGALGMLCAYVYWDLRVNDDHTWPLLPKGAWPAPLALGFVLLVFAPLLGALLYRVVIRGLAGHLGDREARRADLGAARRDRPRELGLEADDRRTRSSPSSVPTTRSRCSASCCSGTTSRSCSSRSRSRSGCASCSTDTRIGVSMRAVVDDRPLLELNGARPDRVSLVSWMIGVSLSALAGILITPFEGGSLSSTLLTLLVINAFAAAMFGRLRNLPADVRRRGRARASRRGWRSSGRPG